jgi:purine nucleosidase
MSEIHRVSARAFVRQTAAVSTTKRIDMNNKKNMMNYSFLLLALLSTLLLQATAAGAEEIRIIMDTDALAEVDDQHAIAYMLFSGDHFEVEGITVNRGSDGPHRTDRDQDINDHFREAVNVVKICGSNVPVLKGPTGNYQQLKGDIEKSAFDGSDAVYFIIERAHAPSDRPLILFACGNLTNVALALLKDPTIAPKIEIWWVGTEWPQNYACNNHAGDLDAVDALLANPQNVAFNIIPWPNGIWTNHAEIYEKMPGKGPEASPGVPGRWGGSFTCFGDYSVELFRKGVWSGQKRRSLLDAFGFAVLKNKSWYTPTTVGAPAFKRTDRSAEEKHKYPGQWVANDSNPRRVTFWRDGQMDPVIADFFHTFDNHVLVGSASD